MSSLFDRVGGDPAIAAAVDGFYERVLADDRLRTFFDGVDAKGLMSKQRDFLSFAFGAQTEWTGQSIRAAHAPLVKRGLEARHFTWVAEHLQDTLESLGLDKDLVSEVLEVVGSTHNDVLGL